MRNHRSAYANAEFIEQLDPVTDYLTIYQISAFRDFARDTRDGLTLAFYRVFAIPHIAELLVKTGEMTRRPAKRSYDTGLVIYELIGAGFDSPRGRKMVKLLNRVHFGLGISQESFRYVLCTFIVTPVRWIESHGWRPLLDVEKEAATRFYRELGTLMNIQLLPANFNEAAAYLDDYERRHVAESSAGRDLMAATLLVFRNRLPAAAKPLTAKLVSTYFGDRPLTAALGLPKPPTTMRYAVKVAYAVRNAITRRRPAKTSSWFVPGSPTRDVYPDGYTLEELGPHTS